MFRQSRTAITTINALLLLALLQGCATASSSRTTSAITTSSPSPATTQTKASASPAPFAAGASRRLHVQLDVSPLSATQASLTATISTTLVLSDVTYDVKTESNFKVISSDLPATDEYNGRTLKQYHFVVEGASALPSRLDFNVYATSEREATGGGNIIFVGQRDGKLVLIPEPEAQYILMQAEQQTPLAEGELRVDISDGFGDITPTAGGVLSDTLPKESPTDVVPQPSSDPTDATPVAPASDTISPDATPTTPPEQSNGSAATASVNMTVKGTFAYLDHRVTTSGVEPNGKPKKIRKALVKIEGLKGTYWGQLATLYTDSNGYFSKYISGFTGSKVRVSVCTIGPDSNQRVRLSQITTRDNAPWCFTPATKSPASTVDFKTSTVADDRNESGQWNIYETALETWEFLSNENGTPSWNLPIIWFPGYNPTNFLGGNTSAYLSGQVRMIGTELDGDQWNDSVIAHEIGHWVMEHYAEFKIPDFYGSHGGCSEGNIRMQYSEGWADFFAAAARSKAPDQDDRTFASWYIDAPDNASSIGTIPNSPIFNRDIESSTRFDSTVTEDFRKGNGCEWQIAGALWDIIDSNADNNDRLTRPFKDVFKAFQTKYDDHFPYDINQWWYGWTNTLGNRSGGSLGYAQQMLDNFADHKILIGTRIELTRTPSPSNIFADLWLPKAKPARLSIGVDGSYTAFPYAAGTTPYGTTEQYTWITSPYKGTYVFAIFDEGGAFSSLNGFTVQEARIKIYDGSFNNGASSPYIIDVPSERPEFLHWWYVFDVDGATGRITSKNVITEYGFQPYD